MSLLLPIVSIKSETVRQQLGIKKGLNESAQRRAVLTKLAKLGVTVFDGEFISVEQMATIGQTKTVFKKLNKSETDWTSGSSFNEGGV